MNTPGDVAPVTESANHAARPAPREDHREPLSPFQEINERRARVENAELLRNLRGL